MSNLGIAQSEITGASGSSSSSSVTFRGAWSNVTSYSTNDIVTRKGSVWIAVTGNTGNDPYLDNGTNWTLFAEGFNFVGTWLVGTSYNYFDVVTLNNSFYLSIVLGSQTNTGHNPQTDGGVHWALLDQGFNFLGAWNVGTSYNPYDVVTFQSSTYINILAVTGGTGPGSDTTHWSLMAAAGAVAPRQTFTFNMPSAPITNVSITSNVVTLAVVNTFTAQGEGTGQGQVNTIYITGLTGASFLNGQVLTIATINGTTITANFTHTNYGPTADSGTATLSIPVSGVYWTTGATGSSIQLAPTFEISRIQCGQGTRIELYSGSTFRTSDASRPATTQPTQFTQHGVIMDLNLDGTIAPFSSWVLSPLAYGANDEFDALPSANISAALTNISGAPTTNGFFVTFTWTVEESGGVASPNADEYVLGAADPTNLPASVANPSAYFGTDAAPGTPGSLDDEFNGVTLNTSTRWTYINQGTSTVTLNGKSVATFFQPTHAADNYPMIVQTAPATPWEVTMKVNGLSGAGAMANYVGVGLVVRDSGTSKFTELFYYFTSSTVAHLSVINYTNPTTVSGNAFDTVWAPLYNAPFYLRWKDDGVNFLFSFSFDGSQFTQVFSISRTAFLATPNQVGIIWASGQSSGTDVYANAEWFRRTV